jgi:hypothetical protein
VLSLAWPWRIIQHLYAIVNTFLSRFNPTSAGAGVTVFCVIMLASVFHNGGHVSCNVGVLSELCHKYVTYICKRLNLYTHLQAKSSDKNVTVHSFQFAGLSPSAVKN